MTKLKQLVSGVAFALGDPRPSVNVLAIQLRKAGLIKSTGRGLNAADMTPADAAALLVSCMAGGLSTETSSTTATMLAAKAGKKELGEAFTGNILASKLITIETFGAAVEYLISS